MSEWTEKIKNHEVWAALNSLETAIDSAVEVKDLDLASAEGLERIRAVATFCTKRLASADPYLLEPTLLTSMCAALSETKEQIDSFAAGGGASNVAAANTHADRIIALIGRVVAPVTSEDITAIGHLMSTYRQTLTRYLTEAASSVATLKKIAAVNAAKLETLSSQVDSESQKISTALTEYAAQFTVAQANRSTEFVNAEADRQSSAAASSSEREKAFSESQSERQAQFFAAQEHRAKAESDVQTERQASFNDLTSSYKKLLSDYETASATQVVAAEKKSDDSLEALESGYRSTAQGILDQINTKKQEVEKLVGVIGNLGVTSGYQLVANSARRAMYLWQTLTVVALVGLIGVAYSIAFTPTPMNGDFVQGLASRIFLSIAVGVFAAYAASQAEKSSTVERRNRKLALELEAVGPYIAPLPEDMQFKFREALGERSFGRSDLDSGKSESVPGPANAIDVLKSKELRDLLDSLQKMLKDKG